MASVAAAGRADLTDAQWAVLQPLLPVGVKPGRPPKWSKRQLGLTRFDGHLRSGDACPRRDVPSWSPRVGRSGGLGGRSPRSSRPESWSCASGVTGRSGREDFDLTETAVRQWVVQAERDASARADGLTTDEREEMIRLRRWNRRLAEDVEILKRATAFFANETR